MERLLGVKRAGQERDVAEEFGSLWAFAGMELQRMKQMDRHFHRTWAPMDQLNVLFRRFLVDIWRK
jgi:hypothetical protein